MSDRTAFFGETLEAARYRFGDTSTDGGNYVVAEDLDGERVLLQFDYDADEWQYAGDVDIGGGDLNSVGTARVDALKAESVNTEGIDIAGQITTVESDAELNNALSSADDGDIIRLLRAEYTDDYTVSNRVTIKGPGGGPIGNMSLDGDWTLDDRAKFASVPTAPNSLTLDSTNCGVFECNMDTDVTINSSDCWYIGNRRGDVELTDNSSNCVVVGNVDLTVTDNGTDNEVVGNT